MSDLPEHLRTARLLIVDDNPANVSIMEKMLRRAGYENVESTTDSRLAKGMYEAARHDLVLLDIRMPFVDGFEVMAQLRDIAGDDYVPILVLTAQTDMDTRIKALAAGAKDFLNKPVDHSEALMRVRNMLEVRLLHKQIKEQNLVLEEKIAERTRELRTAMETAEAGSRAKSEFLAIIGHELRTPLNAIIGFADVMRSESSGPVNDQYQGYLGEIHDSAHGLLSVINDILDISHAEAGRHKPLDRWVDLREAVEAVKHLFEERAREKGVELSYGKPADLPRLFADPAMVKRIIGNLLSNAVKFSDTGVVSVQTERNADGGLDLVIADQGCGIAPEHVRQIMTPFGQTDTGFDRKNVGVGLGLSIANALTELHGGALNVESEVGVGSTVKVSFPRSRIEGED